MNAGVLVENQRLFYKTKGFQGQIVVLVAWTDADGNEIEITNPESNRGWVKVESIKWGWQRVVRAADLHLMKAATFKEWSRDPSGQPTG